MNIVTEKILYKFTCKECQKPNRQTVINMNIDSWGGGIGRRLLEGSAVGL